MVFKTYFFQEFYISTLTKTFIFIVTSLSVTAFLYFPDFARTASQYRLSSYGACGENTDQSQTVKSVLEMLKAGDTLVVDCRAGVGFSGIELSGKDGVSIVGENGGGFKSLAPSGQGIPGFWPVMFVVKNINGCSVKNLVWEGNSVGAAPFGFSNTSNCIVEGNTIKNVSYPANAAMVGVNNRNNFYLNNIVTGTGQGTYNGQPDGTRGMWFGNAGEDKTEWSATVRGNSLSGIGATGIVVMGISPLIEKNTVSNTNGAGIKFVQGDGGMGKALIYDNSLTGNSLHGIQIDDRVAQVLSVSIKRNIAANNGLAGIYAPALLKDSDISDNIVRNNHTNGLNGWHAGIMIFNANGLSIVSNQAGDAYENNSSQDVGLIINPLGGLSASNIEVRDNTFKNHFLHGVAMYNDAGNITGVKFVNNKFVGNKQYGLSIYQKSSGSISGIESSGNCFANNAYGAISDSNRGGLTAVSPAQSQDCTTVAPAPSPAPMPAPAPVAGPTGMVNIESLGEAFNQHGGWAGFKFTVGSKALYVTELGRYSLPGNKQIHRVKLVAVKNPETQSTGEESLGTVTINMAGKDAGQFVYGALPSVVKLEPNTQYYLVSEEFYGGDVFHNSLRGSGTRLASTAAIVNSASYWWPGDPYWRLEGITGSANGPVDLKFSFSAPSLQVPSYPQITLVNNRSLNITIQPLRYENNNWVYLLTWRRTLIKNGSLSINNTTVASSAAERGSQEIILAANSRSKLEFYSLPNKRGILLARKYITVLPAQ